MESASPQATKVIKRYANRKLYDTERSCYVTLDEISGMIKRGEEVKVVDNKTGEDLSAVTLAQIIFEEEKKSSKMPLKFLRNIIQGSQETIGSFINEKVTPTLEKVSSEWEKSLGRVTGRDDDKEPTPAEEAEPRHVLQSFVKNSQRVFDDQQIGVRPPGAHALLFDNLDRRSVLALLLLDAELWHAVPHGVWLVAWACQSAASRPALRMLG